MEKTIREKIKEQCDAIILRIEGKLPVHYTFKARKKLGVTRKEISDHKIINVRNGRTVNLDIAKALEAVAKDYESQVD